MPNITTIVGIQLRQKKICVSSDMSKPLRVGRNFFFYFIFFFWRRYGHMVKLFSPTNFVYFTPEIKVQIGNRCGLWGILWLPLTDHKIASLCE